MNNFKEQLRKNYPATFICLKKINSLYLVILKCLDQRKINRRNRQIDLLSAKLLKKVGYQILRGPFKDMILTEEHNWHPAKLTASYEQELHPIIETFPGNHYQQIINIGCGDGYFAVGLAKICYPAQIEGYDLNSKVLNDAKKLAELNKINNITFHNECTFQDFERNKSFRTLIFCDCEGAEDFLLDQEQCSALGTFDILVETHDHIIAGLTDKLIKRFQSSHQVVKISSEPRNISEYPELDMFSITEGWLALNEFRHGIGTWLWLKAFNNSVV